ncbi:transglutaminase domain-containing protein [Streptomyces sp. NBC_00648]|uniref:transglutaminase domain-containing protein n=1 Tax=Streptomyces sp. NBC_00648 TaxID=2975797 RepID=UPI0032549597
MTQSTAAAGSLTKALGQFHFVPEEFADYSTDLVTATRFLRTEPEQIRELVAAGLPHAIGADGEVLCDYVDLTNVAAFAGNGQTVPELALRFLMRFAASPLESLYTARGWEVVVRPPQRNGETVAVRAADLEAPGLRVHSVEPLDQADGPAGDAPAGSLVPGGYQMRVELTGEQDTVRDPRIKVVYDEIMAALLDESVIYQTVPEELRADHRRAWEMGMADCIVVSRMLADRLRSELGLTARARRGYLLGLLGSDHAWAEVQEDGRWKTLDAVAAHLVSGSRRDLGIGERPEFAAACFGSRFNRFLPCATDGADPLVYFGDRPAPQWALAGVSAKPWSTS